MLVIYKLSELELLTKGWEIMVNFPFRPISDPQNPKTTDYRVFSALNINL